ncbi:MAG TPA: AMP-binding protein [Actinophytocola sp.]|uniref:AMP-binding protein n=1 Tax=Actinophytocola sp. TaxID=1872138 RepID=UPI002DDD651F|nr:AMP-binding protein [Actinophytocola sp.]HEV2782942.1 AMP-binding protein [Actinophytocola sp.]
MPSAGVSVTDQESLTDMVWANAERFGDAISFRRRADHSWLDVTARDFAAQVLAVAKGLIAAGMRPGDRIGLLCGTRYEWSLIDFAIWAAGCVTVPITDGAPAERAAFILSDSDARAVVVETEAHRELVRPRTEIPVWRLGAELTELGRRVDDAEAHARRLGVRSDDVATLVYGPDGPGTLSHRALLGRVRSTIARHADRWFGAGNSMLIRVPLTDVVARVMALCCVYTRTTLAHSPNADDPLADLGTFRPTVVVTEPALLAQVHDAARRRAHAEDRGRFFDAAEAVAVEFSRALDGFGPAVTLRGKHLMASKFVYPKLRVALGGRCTSVVAVGAPVPERLGHFFRGIGIPVHSV